MTNNYNAMLNRCYLVNDVVVLVDWDSTVSDDLVQVTDPLVVLVTNNFIVVKTADDSVELVTVSDVIVVDIVVVVLVVNTINADLSRDDAVDDFLNVVVREGPEDLVDVVVDLPLLQETDEEDFLLDLILDRVVVTDSSLGNNLVVNLDINNAGWLDDVFLLSSVGVDDDVLFSWGNLDISDDIGDFSNLGLVDEEGTVDFVQKVPVSQDVVVSVSGNLSESEPLSQSVVLSITIVVVSIVVTSIVVDWPIPSVGVNVWAVGTVNSSVNVVQVVLN